METTSESALLTDEAIGAIADYFRATGWASSDDEPGALIRNDAQRSADAFLRFHATEGREALVALVADQMMGDYPLAANEDHARRVNAEAVITALFGPPQDR